MPSPEKRVRVERGLYKTGSHYYYACATPSGSRNAVWKALGAVNLMEARRLRDKFRAQVLGAPAPALTNSRRSFGDLAAEWLDEQKLRMDVGEMSPRTCEIYELGLRRHVLPVFSSRQVRAIDPNALVAWIRTLRAAGYAPHSIHNYWGPLHLVLAYAVRVGVIASNPADRLTSAERPKPGSGRRRFLGRDEVERLLDAAPERYRLALACGLFSGLRLSELRGCRGSKSKAPDTSHSRLEPRTAQDANGASSRRARRRQPAYAMSPASPGDGRTRGPRSGDRSDPATIERRRRA